MHRVERHIPACLMNDDRERCTRVEAEVSWQAHILSAWIIYHLLTAFIFRVFCCSHASRSALCSAHMISPTNSDSPAKTSRKLTNVLCTNAMNASYGDISPPIQSDSS